LQVISFVGIYLICIFFMSRYIVSDCDAVKVMQDSHGYAKTPEDAVAYALKAGINLQGNSKDIFFVL
jgi:hypothetical protein